MNLMTLNSCAEELGLDFPSAHLFVVFGGDE